MTDDEKAHEGESLDPEEQARSDLYTLLGALLAAPPKQELIDLLRGIHPGNDTENGVMTAAWSELSLAAREVQTEPLHDEYQRLFIGLGRGELLPYASWYRSGFLMDKPLAALRTDLARLGYVLKEGVCEPEDHAASLCEIMAAIISENNLTFEAQKAFYNSHLAPWMGRFFSDLAQAKTADFYKAVGELGRQFMNLETQYYSMQH